MSDNAYLPKLARIISIKEEVSGVRPIKTFRTQFINGDGFTHQCGQCAMLSIFGKGESMISISSSPLVSDYLQFSILKTGRVTTAIHELQEGDVIGIRGPLRQYLPPRGVEGQEPRHHRRGHRHRPRLVGPPQAPSAAGRTTETSPSSTAPGPPPTSSSVRSWQA